MDRRGEREALVAADRGRAAVAVALGSGWLTAVGCFVITVAR
jgi:hypothetical protein